MYVHTVPFMNAAIQGLDQLYQICRPEYRNDLKEPRWGTDRKQHVNKTLRAGACLAGMAFAVWLWNISDDVKLTQYLDETDYEKASYLTLYDIHDDADIRIPVPFQIGAAFMKVPEIMFESDFGHGNTGRRSVRMVFDSRQSGHQLVAGGPATCLGSENKQEFLWRPDHSGLYGKLAGKVPILQRINPATDGSTGSAN